ncbi:MAG: FHA domain-containing protein [Thioalkalispiraceae bacterium]|jgi:pSer/pThr/pTyr-binding forkhead associated (FHA) protein
MPMLRTRHVINPEKINLTFGEMKVGRAPDNDVCITDTTVSSYHARIFTYLNSSYIEDLHSRNGTFVNGERIEKHLLRPGDTLQVGNHVIIIADD